MRGWWNVGIGIGAGCRGWQRRAGSRRCVARGLLGLLGIFGVAAAGGCGTKPPQTRPPEAGARLYSGRTDTAGIDAGVLRDRRILIDPGHGGRFGGSTGRDSTREADVNLGVALHLWGLLHDAGADVHLTRASDRDLLPGTSEALRDDLAARVAALDSLQPDVFLSLHHNSNAALDRERNAIETYYKLDDAGPSYDLGRAIHAELVQSLGIDEARLRPGNYFVLRGARTAAVLGEASYLSNPAVESKLRLAEKQRLEAVAYFRGLAQYFAHGVAAIEKRAPASDTLQVDGALAFTVGEAVDPATVEVLGGGQRLATRLDADGGGFTARVSLAPGTHPIEARARLARGNAARPWSGHVVVHTPPASAVLVAEPVRALGRVRLQARLADAAGRCVEDGTRVEWRAENAVLLDAEPAIAAGESRAVVQLGRGAATVRVASGAARATLALQSGTAQAPAQAPSERLVRCVDARDGRPLANVWSGEMSSDRCGWLALATAPDLEVECRGYEPWRGEMPADSTLRLQPLHGGVLHGVHVVVDPAGDGGDPALAGAAFAAADVDHDVASRIAVQLAAMGADAPLTRGLADAATDLQRVRAAADADWFVRLEATAPGVPAAVLHWPGSEGGARLATAIAGVLAVRRGAPVAVRAESRFVLQQTPCPSVWLQLPAADFASVAARRDVAYAVCAGLRLALDARAAAAPPLVGVVGGPAAETVTLDGADTVPVRPDGSFRFEHVAAGPRQLAALGGARRSVWVVATGQDTTRATIAPPP